MKHLVDSLSIATEITETESMIYDTILQAKMQMKYILASNPEVSRGFKYLIVCGGYFIIYNITIIADNKPVFTPSHPGMYFIFDHENSEVATGINPILLSLIEEITNA